MFTVTEKAATRAVLMNDEKKTENLPYVGSYSPGLVLYWEQIEEYLNKLEASGCSANTLQSYQRILKQLYLFLPEDKRIQKGMLAAWRDSLLESGLSVNTANVFTSVTNRLMHELGYRELQADRIVEERKSQPELTRKEYLRLLSAAQILEKKKAYLLVKVFGTTGLSVGELPELTVEAVNQRKLVLPARVVKISEGLQRELLSFIRQEGIVTGSVFITKMGNPMNRVSVTSMIRSLGWDAGVEEEKANPRCLKKMYQTTLGGIQDKLFFVVEQSYEQLLEKEQREIGWEL